MRGGRKIEIVFSSFFFKNASRFLSSSEISLDKPLGSAEILPRRKNVLAARGGIVERLHDAARFLFKPFRSILFPSCFYFVLSDLISLLILLGHQQIPERLFKDSVRKVDRNEIQSRRHDGGGGGGVVSWRKRKEESRTEKKKSWLGESMVPWQLSLEEIINTNHYAVWTSLNPTATDNSSNRKQFVRFCPRYQ